MGITIRGLRIDDYGALIRLWDEAGLPYKPQGRDGQEELTHQVQQSTAIYLVAELNGKLVGSVLATHDGRKGWINRLAVSPRYRRYGIARQLVKEVEKGFLTLGIEIFACLIEEWNEVSLEVFKRLGYQKHSDIIYLSKRRNPGV